jgi:hypothetical protein
MLHERDQPLFADQIEESGQYSDPFGIALSRAKSR